MKLRKRSAAIVLVFIVAIVPNVFMPAWFDENTPRLPKTFIQHWMVVPLTGQYSLNDSRLADVMGTDLGIVVKYQGQYRFIFGDTFGGDYLPHQPCNYCDWRSNVMAYSNDSTFSDGIVINGWVTNGTPPNATELFGPVEKIDKVDLTMIPTAAMVDGSKFHIFYMDINHWGTAGVYYTNYGSIAYSDDGVHFTRATNVSWPGDSNFNMFGHVQDFRPDSIATGWEYFLATPAGRYHAAYLLRVPRSKVLDQSAYQYFAGTDGAGSPAWSPSMCSARAVIERPVGELSVMWNEYLQRYVVMYIEHYTATIILRTAKNLWGPWSDAIGVVPFSEYPGLYGSFMHPDLVEDGGRIVYFVMSWWPFYNTYLMAANLTGLI
nr:DUF4185 domain-containing protein [Candidatus Sigynarchaeum springense]